MQCALANSMSNRNMDVVSNIVPLCACCCDFEVEQKAGKFECLIVWLFMCYYRQICNLMFQFMAIGHCVRICDSSCTPQCRRQGYKWTPHMGSTTLFAEGGLVATLKL